MAILSFYNLRQSFAEVDLFSGLAGSLPWGGKVGLVGPNGIGKTTLLRILAGVAEAAEGQVHIAKETRLGYLHQEAEDTFVDSTHTVYDEMLTVFANARAQEAGLRALEAEMAGDKGDELLAQYGKLQEAFELGGGYEYEVWIQQTLQGLGFDTEQQQMPLAHCSGGQKTRALLARLLLEKPDLLVLDEPTNHLDIEAIEWLENTLRGWEGAILIVSHDRYFLDRVVETIWEMSGYGLETYRGNYSAYVQQREERWARREAEFEAVQGQFLKTLDYIKRNIARDSTRDQAWGRFKRLCRQVRAVQVGGTQALNQSWSQFMREGPDISGSKWRVADVEQAIKSLPRPSLRQQQIVMRFNTGDHFPNDVLQAQNLMVGFPGTALFQATELALYRHQCAALIGPNGSGKTTFLRTLLNDLQPLEGTFRLGTTLKISYFAQIRSELDPKKSVLDAFLEYQNALPDQADMLPPQARDYLARYLFQGEDVFKLVKSLSGGETSRLALAVLALPITNLLVLDEPTNHLDIPAQEVLQDALQHFPGTILLVTHDRYLVDKLASEIWEIRDGWLHCYKGTYQDYLSEREAENETNKIAGDDTKADGKASWQDSRRVENESKRREKDIIQTEGLIHQMEARLEELSQAMEMASREEKWEDLQNLGRSYKAVEAELEALMMRWEALSLAE